MIEVSLEEIAEREHEAYKLGIAHALNSMEIKAEHIKNNVLSLGKEPPSKLKLDAIGLPMAGMQQREDDEDDHNDLLIDDF